MNSDPKKELLKQGFVEENGILVQRIKPQPVPINNFDSFKDNPPDKNSSEWKELVNKHDKRSGKKKNKNRGWGNAGKQSNKPKKDSVRGETDEKSGSKYQNERTFYNERWYDSKKEAKFAEDLDWQLRAAAIRAWEPQVKIEIKVNGKHICNYYADFKVYYCDDSVMYFDVKGYKKGGAYNYFKTKKKLIFALYNIEIYEV